MAWVINNNFKTLNDMKRTMTFKQARDLFFENYPEFQSERRVRKSQKDYSCDCRYAFVNFVDYLNKDGQITDNQAFKLTLG